MSNKITILECSDCAGSLYITDKMFDERYTLEFCPYCGLSDIETDTIEGGSDDD